VVFLNGIESVQLFYRLFIMYCHWTYKYQERVGVPLTGLTLPYFCACSKSWSGFPT